MQFNFVLNKIKCSKTSNLFFFESVCCAIMFGMPSQTANRNKKYLTKKRAASTGINSLPLHQAVWPQKSQVRRSSSSVFPLPYFLPRYSGFPGLLLTQAAKKSAGKAEMTVTSVEVTVKIIVTTIYLLEKAKVAVTTAILLKGTTIQGES